MANQNGDLIARKSSSYAETLSLEGAQENWKLPPGEYTAHHSSQFFADPLAVDEGGNLEISMTVVASNTEDPKRKAREFRGRHIQMMALGKAPNFEN